MIANNNTKRIHIAASNNTGGLCPWRRRLDSCAPRVAPSCSDGLVMYSTLVRVGSLSAALDWSLLDDVMVKVDVVADAVEVSDPTSSPLEVVMSAAKLDWGKFPSEVTSGRFSVVWGGSGSSPMFDCWQCGQVQPRDLSKPMSRWPSSPQMVVNWRKC